MGNDSSRIKKNRLSLSSLNATSTAAAASLLSPAVANAIQYSILYGLSDDKLNLSHLGVTDSMIPEIYDRILGFGNKIKVLSLNGNKIKSKGATTLFDKLRESNSTIPIVWLGFNSIDDQSMKSLGEYVKTNNFIEDIDISHNKITDEGIEILFSYFDENVRLKRLGLSGNASITEKITPLLIKMIESSKVIDIRVTGTSIKLINALVIQLTHNIIKIEHAELKFQYM